MKTELVKLAEVIRLAAGLTSSEMARRMGQTRQDYHYFEKRNKQLRPSDLAKLREIFPGSNDEFVKLIEKCGKEDQ